LNFPKDELEEISRDGFKDLFDVQPQETWRGKEDLMLVFTNEDEVKQLKPDLAKIAKTPFRGVIATAIGNKVDFVSRFFTPQLGINEDPVTGSAHTTLVPFWAKKLNKIQLEAKQISNRGGHLKCELNENRVCISGNAIRYLKGEITIHLNSLS
jgi:PhzF family phenazine biosynthesis protein